PSVCRGMRGHGGRRGQGHETSFALQIVAHGSAPGRPCEALMRHPRRRVLLCNTLNINVVDMKLGQSITCLSLLGVDPVAPPEQRADVGHRRTGSALPVRLAGQSGSTTHCLSTVCRLCGGCARLTPGTSSHAPGPGLE